MVFERRNAGCAGSDAERTITTGGIRPSWWGKSSEEGSFAKVVAWSINRKARMTPRPGPPAHQPSNEDYEALVVETCRRCERLYAAQDDSTCVMAPLATKQG